MPRRKQKPSPRFPPIPRGLYSQSHLCLQNPASSGPIPVQHLVDTSVKASSFLSFHKDFPLTENLHSTERFTETRGRSAHKGVDSIRIPNTHSFSERPLATTTTTRNLHCSSTGRGPQPQTTLRLLALLPPLCPLCSLTPLQGAKTNSRN